MRDERDSVRSTPLLWEEAACGLLLADENGLIQQVNETFCAWTGYPKEALVGVRRLPDLLTVGGKIFYQTHCSPLLRMQGSVAELKLDVVTAAGGTLPMLFNLVRRASHGGFLLHVSCSGAVDRHAYERELVLARQRAEQALALQQQGQQDLELARTRLRLAIDLSELFLWDVDISTGTRHYEDNVALLLGYPAARPLTAEEFLAAIAPKDQDRERVAFERALRDGDYNCVFSVQGADGCERIISAGGRGYFDAAGQLIQFVGVLRDITATTLAHRSAEDRALFAEQMMGIVSHDLRNPLSAIHMGTQLLMRADAETDTRRTVERMRAATDRALRLVADLLDFTQARVGGGLSVRLAPARVHEVVARSVAELQLSWPHSKIVHCAEGEGLSQLDADKLNQLVGNLVSNAATYGKAGGTITVTSAVNAYGFTIKVHNEGEPIPSDILPTLFDPMTRGTQASPEARSVGLGLFIVREVARAHGGTVQVQSDAATGTTFTATFPHRR